MLISVQMALISLTSERQKGKSTSEHKAKENAAKHFTWKVKDSVRSSS